MGEVAAWLRYGEARLPRRGSWRRRKGIFRWVHPSLYEGVSVRRMDGPSDGPSDGNLFFFLVNRNHWGRPTLTLLNVLKVLNVLNVLNMPIRPIAQNPSPRDPLILKIIKVNPNCIMQMRLE